MSKTKALKEAMHGLVTKVSTIVDFRDPLKHQEEILVHLIQMQEGFNPCSTWA